ncbi:MAG TPA: hypothetical protein VNC60_06880 [Actinomycetota bacterium]|nr:hypothetical protein [Actinomycetota bacterium]
MAASRDERPAFYALAPGSWRDWWTLLHPPYTVWHLSYVVIGASLTPGLNLRWLGETMLAFFFAMGVAAHALDELHSRPLGTQIPGGVLVGVAVAGLVAAVALGVDGMLQVSSWLGAFVAAGTFLVLAYNLELLGGVFHSDLWFALAWGAFPALTASFAQTARLSVAALIAAAACAVLSAAQRVLSTPVRRLRRHVVAVHGELTLDDGTREPIDAGALRSAPERALRLLSIAVPLVALSLLLASVSGVRR